MFFLMKLFKFGDKSSSICSMYNLSRDTWNQLTSFRILSSIIPSSLSDALYYITSGIGQTHKILKNLLGTYYIFIDVLASISYGENILSTWIGVLVCEFHKEDGSLELNTIKHLSPGSVQCIWWRFSTYPVRCYSG